MYLNLRLYATRLPVPFPVRPQAVNLNICQGKLCSNEVQGRQEYSWERGTILKDNTTGISSVVDSR